MKQSIYHQDEIRPFLIKYLTAAKQQIHLAIGWIDDSGLLALLEKKTLEGVKVVILLVKDQDYASKNTAYQSMIDKGVRVIGLDEDKKEYFIDHKFGVIDSSVVLTGNYGWGHNHTPSECFLTVSEQIPSLALGFQAEFEFLSIVEQLSKNEIKPPNPVVDLLKKLEVKKILLSIGDTEFIHLRLSSLEDYRSDKNIALILQLLKKKEFEEALETIKKFTQFHQTLRECIDPPIDSYRREIQLLEDEIAALSTEYNETQKMIHKFSKMHSDVLGDLLLKLLNQTKIKAEIDAKAEESNKEKQEEFEEAKKDHEEYTESYEAAKREKLKTLTKEEQKELKKLYRQTSLKCHPDRVVDELHDQAEEIFVELNQAYKANDLETVRKINQQLKSGIMLPKSEGITELKKLESTFKSLNQKLNDWQEKLTQLKEESTYKAVASIENWELYFDEKKAILLQQLDRLKASNEKHLEDFPSENAKLI